MIRFFVIWIFLTICVFVYRYIFGNKERKITNIQVKNICVSMLLSGGIVVILYYLNQIQGL